MAFRNVTIVNGVKIELKDLDPEDELNTLRHKETSTTSIAYI